VQINTGDSRIDFKLENFSSVVTVELEKKVDQVLNENHTLKSYYITEQEFQQCSDLLRALVAKTDDKGKNNKRLYLRLDLPELPHFLHKS